MISSAKWKQCQKNEIYKTAKKRAPQQINKYTIYQQKEHGTQGKVMVHKYNKGSICGDLKLI